MNNNENNMLLQIIAVILLLVSCYLSCSENKYLYSTIKANNKQFYKSEYITCKDSNSNLKKDTIYNNEIHINNKIQQRVIQSCSDIKIDIEELENELNIHNTPDRDYDKEVNIVEPMNYRNLHINELKTSPLPEIRITLPDDYMLSREYIDCKVSMYNTADSNLNNVDCKIKIRGNVTAMQDKKPFRLKFDKKVAMFGGTPHKNWNLIANRLDVTSIHNYVSYNLYRNIVPKSCFTPKCEFVNLYINDRFIGLYNLCDQVEAENGRVGINKKANKLPEYTDYLIEQEFRLPSEEPENENISWFWLKFENLTFEVKSPDVDDGCTKEHIEYINSYFDKLYLTLKKGNWNDIQELLDVESFIYGFLVNDIIRNTDINVASVYYAKRAGGKLYFATIWDCDSTFGTGGSFNPDGSILDENWMFSELIKIPEFRKLYIDTYDDLHDEIYYYVLDTIDNVSEKYKLELENEYINWTHNSFYNIPEYNNIDTYSEQIELMKEWFKKQYVQIEHSYDYYRKELQ